MKIRIWLMLLIVGSTFIFTSSQTYKQTLNKQRIKRSQQELILSPDDICDRFSNPIPTNKTFFSPINFTTTTNNYISKVDCILLLQAPEEHVIQLDFRNIFNIEPSAQCEYDYLEVRDGRYGFSKLLGKFCGRYFPSIIKSSDRYLWLHFHSDESIEYEGFQGVYEFFPRSLKSAKIDECFFSQINQTEGNITRNDINSTLIKAVEEESKQLDCLWMIEVLPNWQIMLSFDNFELELKNNCDGNFLDVYGNNTDVSAPLKHFCGVSAEPVESKSNRLHIRFFAEKKAVNSSFSIYYTAFTKKRIIGDVKVAECGEGELDCEDDTCISETLRCNHRNNCKFQKDEEKCNFTDDSKWKDLLCITIVFSSLLGTMISVFLFNCIRKLIRDQKIIREHIRQSKESKLDEAGRISLKRSLESINAIAPRTSGSQLKTIQIHDEDAGYIFHDNNSPSISESLHRTNKNQYNYRDQLKNILRIPPPPSETINNNAEHSDSENVCDMACQTRESLFATGISSKLPQPNSQSPGTYKFSTFGYNHTHVDATTETSSPYSNIVETIPQTIDVIRTNATIDNYEYVNKYGTPPPIQTNIRIAPKKVGKMEESRLMLEIRNSAPDVIIMTSH